MSNAPQNMFELVGEIPAEWLEPTREIALKLKQAGHRAWIVGGAVRDLLLRRPIKDIDLVSAALPDEVEALFPKTVAVGKSFGIIVVVSHGKEVEVATFRRERGYSDRRRPDEIVFADSPEVDAKRRDFTCNALFLDPLTGEVCDPEGGLADLRAGELSAVGDPADRFREDGLRLLRMARFAATLDLELGVGLLSAAEAERESIVGVSPERVFDELSKCMAGEGAADAMAVLESAGIAELCVPGWSEGSIRVEQLKHATASAPKTAMWALLLGGDAHESMEHLDALRAPRELRKQVGHAVALSASLRDDAMLESWDALSLEDRGARIERWRDAALPAARAILVGRFHGDATFLTRWFSYVVAIEANDSEAPREFELPNAKQLMGLGVAPGPALGVALGRMTHAALGGAFPGTDMHTAAVRWLKAEGIVSGQREEPT